MADRSRFRAHTLQPGRRHSVTDLVPIFSQGAAEEEEEARSLYEYSAPKGGLPADAVALVGVDRPAQFSVLSRVALGVTKLKRASRTTALQRRVTAEATERAARERLDKFAPFLEPVYKRVRLLQSVSVKDEAGLRIVGRLQAGQHLEIQDVSFVPTSKGRVQRFKVAGGWVEYDTTKMAPCRGDGSILGEMDR